MVNIQGLVHCSIPVTDLDTSTAFYSDLLGLPVVLKVPTMVFLGCGEEDVLILGKSENAKKPKSEDIYGVHYAFRVEEEDFWASIDYLREKGVEVFHQEDRKEGVFVGLSAYFHDPDGTILEIHVPNRKRESMWFKKAR